jgi:ABC-type branched-subunit amino acid transport system substrate-binding protein
LSRRTSKALAAASFALAAMIAVASCGGTAHRLGGRHKLDLKIGDLVPISGVEEPFGATGQKAANLAVDEIRKAIKVSHEDHSVSISHQNYRSEPKLAQDLAGRLVRDGTSCLVGPWSTAAVIPVTTEIAVKKKVVEITPAASNDALNTLEIGGYLNRTIAPAQLQGEALATLIAKEIGGAKRKKVSIGALKNIYGTDLVRSFAAAWGRLGGKISARVVYEQNLPNYKKEAKELVARKPDAWAFFDFQENYTRVATDLIKTHKWKANRSFATDSLAVSTLGQSGGATVEGLRGVAPSWPRVGPSADAFKRLWLAGPPPRYRQPYDPQAFDAVVLCYLSAVAAGSTKGADMRNWVRKVSSPPGTKYTWRQLPAAIRALEQGKDIDYEGASGPINIEPLDITKAADPTAGFYDAYRFKDARLSLYGSVSVTPSKQALERIPLLYVTPRIPGVGPQPKPGATGASGASGATGAKGKQQRRQRAKAKKKATNK